MYFSCCIWLPLANIYDIEMIQNVHGRVGWLNVKYLTPNYSLITTMFLISCARSGFVYLTIFPQYFNLERNRSAFHNIKFMTITTIFHYKSKHFFCPKAPNKNCISIEKSRNWKNWKVFFLWYIIFCWILPQWPFEWKIF